MALTDNLQAYWNLNQSSGNAIDNTGNGNTGTLVGAPTYVAGLLGNGLSFNSSNDVTTPLNFPTTGSVQMWVNLPSKPFDFIGPWSWGTGAGPAVGIEEGNGAGTWALVFNASGSGENDISGGAVTFGTWIHFVATWSLVATTWTVNFYKNAVSQGTTTHTGTTGALGTFVMGAFVGSQFTGIIDETGVWSRVLVQAEVTQLYNGGAGLAYPFSSGTTTTTPIIPKLGLNNLSGLTMLNF